MVSWLLALDALHVAVVRGPTPYCSAKPARACAPAAPPGARCAANKQASNTATGGDHATEHCPACGLQVGGGGEVPELALSRSDRFVAVLSGPLVEQPYSRLLTVLPVNRVNKLTGS